MLGGLIDRTAFAISNQPSRYTLNGKPVVPPFKYDRGVSQLRRDGSYKLTPYRDLADLDVFRAAPMVTAWKMNQGIDVQSPRGYVCRSGLAAAVLQSVEILSG